MQRLLDADAAAAMFARENSGFSVDASVQITLIDHDAPSSQGGQLGRPGARAEVHAAGRQRRRRTLTV
jgi:hypothetical protein